MLFLFVIWVPCGCRCIWESGVLCIYQSDFGYDSDSWTDSLGMWMKLGGGMVVVVAVWLDAGLCELSH